jgi:hypothetical protein
VQLHDFISKATAYPRLPQEGLEPSPKLVNFGHTASRPKPQCWIPNEDLNILVNTIDEASSLDSSGRVGDGYQSLEYGLESAASS